MKSAKEMFEKNNFVYDDSIEDEINYFRKRFISDTDIISFNLKRKTLEIYVESDSPFTPNKPLVINFKELQAINKQIEELGRNDEK